MRQRHVRHQTLAEEGGFPLEGAIQELVDQHEVAGRQILAQRADGRDGEDLRDARPLKHVDVGTEVQVAGGEHVATAVTRQEDQPLPVELSAQQRVGRLAERGGNLPPFPLLQPFDVVDTTTANDADDRRHARFAHALPRSRC